MDDDDILRFVFATQYCWTISRSNTEDYENALQLDTVESITAFVCITLSYGLRLIQSQ